MTEKNLVDVLGLKETTLMRIFRWMITSEDFSLLLGIFNSLKSVENLEINQKISNIIKQKHLRLDQATIELEFPIEEDTSAGRRTFRPDLIIKWPDALELIFEAKKGSLPDTSRKTQSSVPSEDPYHQILVYLENSDQNIPNSYLISMTADKEDLYRLNHNLIKKRLQNIEDVFWISWADIQQLVQKKLIDLRNDMNKPAETIINELALFVKLQELERAINKIVYPFKTNVVTRDMMDVFLLDYQEDDSFKRQQFTFFSELFHQRVKNKLKYFKPSASIDERLIYEEKPIRRFWVGFWENRGRFEKKETRSPNIYVEYSYNKVEVAIFQGDTIKTLKNFLENMKSPMIVTEFYKLLESIEVTIQVNSQAYDRSLKHEEKDLCDTEPFSTQEMSKEDLQKLIHYMQQYQQEQDNRDRPRRKTGFRLSITIKDIYSDEIFDHMENALNQLFPVYRFILNNSGVEDYS